jgi:1-deoxy-D-xylulose-5-phosphate synthase
VPAEVPAFSDIPGVERGRWEQLREGGDVALLAVGTMVLPAMEAAARLAEEGVEAAVVNCRFMKPYDRELLGRILVEHRAILTLEEGAVANGFGAFLTREILDDPGLPVPERMGTLGLPDAFIEHGPRGVLLRDAGIDVGGIVARTRALLRGRGAGAGSSSPGGMGGIDGIDGMGAMGVSPGRMP